MKFVWLEGIHNGNVNLTLSNLQNQVKVIIVFLLHIYFLLHIFIAYLEIFLKHYNKVTFQ